MRRLVVQCTCGERIQVPHSALGRAGLCPSCGATVMISKDNATPFRGVAPAPQQPGPRQPDRAWTGGGVSTNAPEDIRRRFAEGVDLYFAKRYSEALVIFNTLAAAMPHDADIQMGQTMCLNALRKVAPLGIGHAGMFGQLPAPDDMHDRADSLLNGPTPTMDRDFFKRFLFDKMLNGQGDDVQMRAAELAAKMFGLLDDERPDETVSASDETEADIEDDVRASFDLPRPTPFRRVAPDDVDR
ncbi:MAG: hypothetical protein FJY92_05195 [Candidatus Hydrogenedentes bacterium]|nr:hypothetical protein [Candidatus Hydrogenedentota bacterium]